MRFAKCAEYNGKYRNEDVDKEGEGVGEKEVENAIGWNWRGSREQTWSLEMTF